MNLISPVFRNETNCIRDSLLTKTTLHTDILARDLGDMELIGTAGLTKIRIALPYGQITRALLRIALRLASATGKPVLALAATLTEFLAEILCLYARTRVVALTTWMIARCKVMHVIST